MITKIKQAWLMPTLALIAVTLGGCLLGGTFMLEFQAKGPFRYSFNGSDKGAFDGAHVDLTLEPNWLDHKDDIDRIESFHFGGIVTNNAGMDDLVSMYISKTRYLSATELHAGDDVYPLLVDMHIPGTADMLVVRPSITDEYRISDKNTTKAVNNILLGGIFYTYATGKNTDYDLTFQDCDYYVAFSASK